MTISLRRRTPAATAWSVSDAAQLELVHYTLSHVRLAGRTPHWAVAQRLQASLVSIYDWEMPPPCRCHSGSWGHGGAGQADRMRQHNRRGEAYAHWIEERGGSLKLRDSPDFSGSLDGITILGDSGSCGIHAFLTGWAATALNQADGGGLWVTLFNDIQIVIEPLPGAAELFESKALERISAEVGGEDSYA